MVNVSKYMYLHGGTAICKEIKKLTHQSASTNPYFTILKEKSALFVFLFGFFFFAFTSVYRDHTYWTLLFM